MIKIKLQNLIVFTASAVRPNIYIEDNGTTFDDFLESGWSIAKDNPENIIKGFSQLHIKREYKLVGYQYSSGGNGNGIVWAIPSNQVQPSVHFCEETQEGFLKPPKPKSAIEDFMKAIDGDRSPLSYLQAAICYHDLHEYGAMWHGVSWGEDQILPIDDSDYIESGNVKDYLESIESWVELKEIPDILSPHFFYENGHPIIIFYTMNPIGTMKLNRYIHTFNNGDYTQVVTQEVIGEGSRGIIF